MASCIGMNLEERPFNSDMKSPSNPYKTYWNAIIIAQNTNVNMTVSSFCEFYTSKRIASSSEISEVFAH